jgi:two-component system, NtrC family, nitrogen regulation response regulator GlnG
MGLFEEADGGILFLDEIGDIPLTIQNRLLKAIDEEQFKRLGTNQYQFCEVQIIAATSRNLPMMIEQGDFREDLYCRLAVLTMETTPLRERREDIPPMINLFLREATDAVVRLANQRELYRIEEDALALLCEFDYPGNIRSLRNLIYELTSYVEDERPISGELVQFALARLTCRGAHSLADANNDDEYTVSPVFDDAPTLVPDLSRIDSAAQQSFLNSIAREGDIILPLELCVLRRGETFKQWTARAKRCSIEAARQATGGTMRTAADRLGLTRGSVKGFLRRTKHAQKEALFEWREPD